jgi:hypothetical protein
MHSRTAKESGFLKAVDQVSVRKLYVIQGDVDLRDAMNGELDPTLVQGNELICDVVQVITDDLTKEPFEKVGDTPMLHLTRLYLNNVVCESEEPEACRAQFG